MSGRGTRTTRVWGLDYPPLMAYVEKVLGAFSHAYDPASVALDASRGYEEGHHRAFMRLTVLVIDALVWACRPSSLSRSNWRPRRSGALY